MNIELKNKAIADYKQFIAAIETYCDDCVNDILEYLDKNTGMINGNAVSYSVPLDQIQVAADFDFFGVPDVASAGDTFRMISHRLYVKHGILFKQNARDGHMCFDFVKVYWNIGNLIDEIVSTNKDNSPEGMEFDRANYFNRYDYEEHKEFFNNIWKQVIEYVSGLNDVELLGNGKIKVKYSEAKHRVPEEE